MRGNVYIYILVMAAVTYIIRMLPLTIIQKEIKNNFIKSFLFYVPYVCLGAMTFPTILFATSSVLAASIGFIVAILISFWKQNIVLVAIAACVTVFIIERLIAFV